MEALEAIFLDEIEQPTDIVRQCDACLDNVFFKKDRVPMQHQYYSSEGLNTIKIDSNKFIVFTTTSLAIINQQALTFLETFSVKKLINNSSKTIKKFIQYGFLKPYGEHTIAYKEKIDKLTTWIHITDSCNLRCHYCFLPHDPKFLSVNIAKKIVDSLVTTAKENGLKKIKLKYAGGEPLQNFKVLQQLHHYALSFSKKIEFTTSILTNGTLLNVEKLKWIKEHNIRLIISLDNIYLEKPQRIFKDGTDSSLAVIKKIAFAKEQGVTPFISITINNQTIKNLSSLLEWILKERLPFSINFYKGLKTINETELIKKMREAFKVIEANLPKHSLLNALLDMTNFANPHLRGCSVGQNYLIFDTEGNISQCPMTMNKPITSIKEKNILQKIQTPLNPLKNFSVDEKEDCKICKWRYWCGGGCAVINQQNQGKSPYCEVYKELFPEVLRLEGIRIKRDLLMSR